MTDLIRTKQGKISLKDTNNIDDDFTLHSIIDSLDYEKIVVDDILEKKISNGVSIPNEYEIDDKVIFVNKENKLLGIYEVDETHLKVWKNFV
jgi:hypothetical protein